MLEAQGQRGKDAKQKPIDCLSSTFDALQRPWTARMVWSRGIVSQAWEADHPASFAKRELEIFTASTATP